MDWVDNCDFLELSIKENIDNIVFTANSVVTRKGLVMGRGAALRIREAYPGIASEFGRILDRMPCGDYHVISVKRPVDTPSTVYALQVKRNYRDPGDFDLCRNSLRKLVDILDGEPAVLNCPLILNGGFNNEKQLVYEMVEFELKNTNILVTRID